MRANLFCVVDSAPDVDDELDLNAPTVVVGYDVGDDGPALAKFISERGHRVENFVATADDAQDKLDRWIDTSTEHPRMFFLVVTKVDVDEGNRSWVRSGVLDQARKLLTTYGRGRVILVVEAGISDFDYKTGMEDLLFPSGNLDSLHGEVAAFVLREFPSDVREGRRTSTAPVLQRRAGSPVERDVKVALFFLALTALVGSWYVVKSLFGPSEVDTATPRVSGVRQTAPPPPSTTLAAPPAPASTPVPALRSTCRVPLSKSVVLPEIIYCTGGGGLRVTGYRGPWHNEIFRVGVENQISGTLVYEQNGEVVVLSPGVTNLSGDKSRFGVEFMEVTFTADGRRVQFEQFAERGQRVVTFTFDASLQR